MATTVTTAGKDPALVPSRADSLSVVHGLNAARAMATILVLFAHAGIPYMAIPLRTTLWLVHDASHSMVIDVLLSFVNCLAMPLFFLMAGMSAGAGLSSGTASEFIKRRVSRLGTPLLIGILTIVPVCYVLWGLGLLFSERVPMAQLYRVSLPPHIRATASGPFHLWFLEYLLVLSVVLCLAALGIRKWREWKKLPPIAPATWLRWFGNPWTFAAVSAGLLCFDLDASYRLHNSFLPDVLRMTHYFVFFAAGALIAKLPNVAVMLKMNAIRNSCLAMILYVALLPLLMQHIAAPLTGWSHYVLAVGQSVFVWLALFGGIGLCIRSGWGKHNAYRYLSEASFWIYLIHVPVVAFLQLWLWHIEANVWLKLAAATVATLVISIASYEWCVRYSYLGELVNGGRKRLTGASAWRKEIGWVAVGGGLATWLGIFVATHLEGFVGPQLEAVVPGEIYRSHRLKPQQLQAAFEEHHFRTVISIARGTEKDRWFLEQRRIAGEHQATVVLTGFDEHQVPSSEAISQLAELIRSSPKPILFEGHKTPTLGGLGAAVALLVDEEGNPAAAKEQFSFEHFQLEGIEHCIVARPVRDYDTWLVSTNNQHSPSTFLFWASSVHRSPEELHREADEATLLQARLGAPRYTERLR